MINGDLDIVDIVVCFPAKVKHTECRVGLDQLRCGTMARRTWSCAREVVSSVDWWYSWGM